MSIQSRQQFVMGMKLAFPGIPMEAVDNLFKGTAAAIILADEPDKRMSVFISQDEEALQALINFIESRKKAREDKQ